MFSFGHFSSVVDCLRLIHPNEKVLIAIHIQDRSDHYWIDSAILFSNFSDINLTTFEWHPLVNC